MKKIIYIILILSTIISQDTEFKIMDISVTGNLNTADYDIINFSGLSIKNSVTALDIQNAIKRLWLLNKFEDIQIDVEETYQGIYLIIND